MKKRFLLFTLTLAAFSFSHAQITKGTISIGGNLGFNSITAKDEFGNNTSKTNAGSFSISPSIGKAWKENTVTGINASFGASKTSITNKYDNKNALLGVFVRKYIPLGKGFYIYGQGSVAGTYSDNKLYQLSPVNSQTGIIDRKGIGAGVYLDAGLSYQVSKKVLLELAMGNLANLSYTHQWDKQVSGPAVSLQKSNNFYFNSGLNLSNLLGTTLGFRILLPS